MAVVTAPIDIAKLALDELKQAPIASLDEKSTAARVVTRHYDTVRRSLLRTYSVWNFARKRGKVTLVEDQEPLFDYRAYYKMPDDLIRLMFVGEDYNRYRRISYDVEGRNILVSRTDCLVAGNTELQKSIPIKYIFDNTNVSEWDPLFVDCMVLALARAICLPVTGDKSLLETLESGLKIALKEAAAINHQENPLIVTDVDRMARTKASDYVDFGDRDLPIDPTTWDL